MAALAFPMASGESVQRHKDASHSYLSVFLENLPQETPFGSDWNIILPRDGSGTVEREFGQGEHCSKQADG
jgi:hypothetical protein